MDAEETGGYDQPCSHCSAVDWAVSDGGQFYCKSCHNIIERTKEVIDGSFTPGSTRISSISRRSRGKTHGSVRQWMICEGFQFILLAQADALLSLGVCPHFKDAVLYQMWKLYLQMSRQAYTRKPVQSTKFKMGGADSTDLETDSTVTSCLDTDSEMDLLSTAGSSTDWSSNTGSPNPEAPWPRQTKNELSMKMTLAFIHLALVWSRETLTLSDLLRLVNDGHVPYVDAYGFLPEEMKSDSRAAVLFIVDRVPSHRSLHHSAQTLAHFLQLPSFPPITQQSLLHPALLSLRYLSDANLPDQLHLWLCRLMQQAGMAEHTLHTFHPCHRTALPRYDAQAAALIIVTMKVVFGMDDHTEWDLSNEAGDHGKAGKMFNVRHWYRLMQAALFQAQHRQQEDAARKQWKVSRHVRVSKTKQSGMVKKKRVAEQVQICFEKLSAYPAGIQSSPPSSFKFCWGDQDGSCGPSMHHMSLDEAMTPCSLTYWHSALKPCNPRDCGSHYNEVEATLPRSFTWLLQLFSFMLDVDPGYLYEEVLCVERRLIPTKTPHRSTTKTRQLPRRSPQTFEPATLQLSDRNCQSPDLFS
ncbi:TATA box-binding protein-associated factor RNA polymerase I subunit B [Genypterus blacodes]|uniref:TATA box-binding protein-associated factor RNA polymerase I subunit B n=1 Tax=Genypterus blacodes TaxID=154954 RepID=UPI003F75B3C8